MTDPFCEGLRATIRDAIASHFDTYTDEELREFVAESLNLLKRPTLADMLPADKVREIAVAMRAAMRRDEHAYPEAKFLADLSGYIKDLEALLPGPKLPTMADMTEEERAACQWMQADTETWGRVVIITPHLRWGSSALLDRRGDVAYEAHANITPRPDLPRLEWPGTEKPDPAPALPGDWKLADHRKHGRVIVATKPNCDGNVYFLFPSDWRMGYDYHHCRPDELTYLDQEAATSDAVPPGTLAVGSEWGDIDALTTACRESGRGQIVVADCQGDVSVWSAVSGWWEAGIPSDGYEPFTILHSGKKAAQ